MRDPAPSEASPLQNPGAAWAERILRRASEEGRVNMDYAPEATLVRGMVPALGNGFSQEIRCPAAPEPPSFVRAVLVYPNGTEVELVYWTSDEWRREDKDLACIGAIFGIMCQVSQGICVDIRDSSPAPRA